MKNLSLIPICSKHLLIKSTSVLSLLVPTCIFAATYDVNQLREASIVLVRQGQVHEGLKQLESLLKQYPNDQKVLADYWVISSQQNSLNREDVKTLSPYIQVKKFPDYAYLSVIRSLRDHQQFNKALLLAQQFDMIHPSDDLKLLQGVLWAELQQYAKANQQLNALPIAQLNADQLSLMAYAYRLSQNDIASLNAAKAAYVLAPQKPAIQEQYVQALLAMGSYKEATRILAQTNLATTKPQLKAELIVRQYSQNVKDAISRYDYLSGQGESDATSFSYLDEVLAAAPTQGNQLAKNSGEYLRFYYDYLYALRFRGRSADVIALKDSLSINMMQMPAYVRQAVADSYLNLKQPEQAEQWYRALLHEKNYSDMSVYSGLYFSYIEQEKYKQANALLKAIDSKIPLYSYSDAVGVDRTPARDRQEYTRLIGMDLAYTNSLEKAERYYRDILKNSPNNPAYLTALATILRWREQPLAAQQTLARLDNITPVDKATRINTAQTYQALGDIQTWHEQLNRLIHNYPQDSSVISSRREWYDRSHASVSYQTDFGHSRTDQVSQSLKGTRDRNAELRINSPWFNDNYRIFAVHQDRTGEYNYGTLRDQRYGLGLEWASKRKDFSVALTQNKRQAQTGIDVHWSQWLNDHWNYGLGFNSQAPIALQAIDANKHGQQYSANLRWQKNESKKINFGYTLTDISDGNQQNEWVLNYTQRLFSSAHHLTQATISNYFAKNSRQDVNYFSPKTHYGSDITIAHDWVTWRKYDRDFVQHFEAGVGFYHQHDYATKATWNVQYTHLWSLSRTWQLNYGIGVSSHPYDGQHEKRVYGLFGFQGVF
ncbi:MAG: poly-beta-1,6 N-acetyl-D-glucosamine export porin PgaA [Acinetobacter sp.]